jgi:NADH dehydrogenase (ubiquinone) 1 beta subcomplex subunit 8
VNPPAIKRQHRDPYGDWWDKQERRNYGEPVHEDNDILGVFSPEDYTHFSPGWAGVLMGCFAGAVGVLIGAVYLTYPDRPSAPRTYPGGLEQELGGAKALRVCYLLLLIRFTDTDMSKAPKEGDFD